MDPFRSLRSSIRDHMREVRFIAREIRGSLEANSGLRAGHPVLGLARLSETALGQMQAVAEDIRSAGAGSSGGPHSLRMLLDGTEAFSASFTRGQYAAAKRLIRSRSSDENPLIRETALTRAFLDSRNLIDDERPTDIAVFGRWAALTARIIAAYRPIASPEFLVDPATGEHQDANVFVACTLMLGTLVASLDENLAGMEVVYDSAAEAVAVRYEDFASALAASDEGRTLTTLMMTMAQRLP